MKAIKTLAAKEGHLSEHMLAEDYFDKNFSATFCLRADT